MSTRSEAEMSDAVRECVTKCLEARISHDCIDEFVRRLVDERGWPEYEASQIARDATDVLRRLGPHFGRDRV
jgi:hypothetical protein